MVPNDVLRRAVLTRLAPLSALLEDSEITEILVKGPSRVLVERRGRLETTPDEFPSVHALEAALQSLAQLSDRPLDREHPVLEGRLPDGSRFTALVPPATPEGPVLAVRRRPGVGWTLETLVERGALSVPSRTLIEGLLRGRANVLVSGGPSSGKTAILGALASAASRLGRTVVVEEVSEMVLDGGHVVRLQACPGDALGRGRIGISELLRVAVRLRPHGVVLGEVRGGEVLDLFQVMTAGHRSCFSSLDAAHPADVPRRLEAMARQGGYPVSDRAVREQIAAAVNVIVHTDRGHDGARVVTHVTRLSEAQGGSGYELVDLFVRPAQTLEPTIAGRQALATLAREGEDATTAETYQAGREQP